MRLLGQEDVTSVPFSSGTASTDDVSTVGDGRKHSLSGTKDTDESSAPRLSALDPRCVTSLGPYVLHAIGFIYIIYISGVEVMSMSDVRASAAAPARVRAR